MRHWHTHSHPADIVGLEVRGQAIKVTGVKWGLRMLQLKNLQAEARKGKDKPLSLGIWHMPLLNYIPPISLVVEHIL